LKPRLLLLLFLLVPTAAASETPGTLSYTVALSERQPDLARFELRGPGKGAVLAPARGGEAAAVEGVRCGRRRLTPRAGRWTVPAGCARLSWRVRLAEMDRGVDASLPPSGWSAAHRFWFLAERHGWLRPAGPGRGSVTVRLRDRDGRTTERRFAFPSLDEPPFYAAVGGTPSRVYAADGLRLDVHGEPPPFAWIDPIHERMLAAWARWRRDLIPPGVSAPAELALAWLPLPPEAEPGYSASAGAAAIAAQIRLRDGDPDGEAKARAVIAAGAAHEGFHTVTGAGAQAWPAWVNESLANHFAVEAVRAFLDPADFAWVERFHVEPRLPGGLLAAQRAYAAGDGAQSFQFYTKGARFWVEIEKVLTGPANGSGRLAALIRGSGNFRGVDLNDPGALAAFLDRHSGGAAAAVVDCFLVRADCDSPAPYRRRAEKRLSPFSR
jgi:hypothetical protein